LKKGKYNLHLGRNILDVFYLKIQPIEALSATNK